MKKWVCLLLFLAFLPATQSALAEGQYEAIALKSFYLFTSPENGEYMRDVVSGEKLTVLEYGDAWCYVQYGWERGYCKTTWIDRFRSLDPMNHPLPGLKPMNGYIVFDEDVFISNPSFQGLTAEKGQIACVRWPMEGDYILPVWRTEENVKKAAATFHPFVDWKEARPGDVIGGYTTFFGPQQGKGRPAERQYNIELGCRRLDETVWAPQAYFSFNALCAPYSDGNGYQYAPNISKSGYGYGGGVCQLTTTLYNAVLGLPLQVEEWELHMYLGVAYVPHLFDAAVGYYSDFAFTNLLPYPIKVQALPQDGVLTVLILRAE